MKRALATGIVALGLTACGEPETEEGHTTSPRVSDDQARLSLDGTDYYGRISINITSLGSDTDTLLFVQALEPLGGLGADGTAFADIDDMLQLVLEPEQLDVQPTQDGVSIAPAVDPATGMATAHTLTRRDTGGGRSTWESFELVGGSVEISATGSLSGALLAERTADFDWAAGEWVTVTGEPALPIAFAGDDTTVYCFEGETLFELAAGATLPCTAVKKTRQELCGGSAAPSESRDGTTATDPESMGSLLLPGCE